MAVVNNSVSVELAWIGILHSIRFNCAQDRRRFSEWLLNREEKYPHPTEALSYAEPYLDILPGYLRKTVLTQWKKPRLYPYKVELVGDDYKVSAGPVSVIIPNRYYLLLSQRYTGAAETRDEAIFTCYLRYYLVGSAGQQAAIPAAVWQVLKEFGVTSEAFASPLNGTLPNFGSAFPQLDKPFGSLGRFKMMELTNSVEANPPFLPQAITELMERVFATLDNTAEQITWILVPPPWTDMPWYKPMLASPDLRCNHLLDKNEHHYVDTLTGGRYEAITSSRLVVMQNGAAFDTNPFNEKWLAQIRAAFK